MKKYQSNAQWPKGCFDSQNNLTTDKHETLDSARGICFMLEKYGAGGDEKIFPLKTWVTEI